MLGAGGCEPIPGIGGIPDGAGGPPPNPCPGGIGPGVDEGPGGGAEVAGGPDREGWEEGADDTGCPKAGGLEIEVCDPSPLFCGGKLGESLPL